MQVAIDGPASSGKSTISKLIAKENHFVYLDTGAMYRVVTLAVLRNKISIDDHEAIEKLVQTIEIGFSMQDGKQSVFMNGEDVTDEIRSVEVTKNVSAVSAIKEVRTRLVHLQQEIAENHSIIMDGRDIGTVVLPQAEIKIFLVASVEERAKRRFIENQEKGIEMSYEELVEDIRRRDHIDSTRKESPLRKAEDAIEIDTTTMTIEDVVKTVTALIQKNQ
ncbi:(d)CMP kinase [uncultured Granulicatella sp.]|jgi:cytidylate kinase|uniref:(d)CMP kinase n=1 Tax=uncultured Granulicatella sp. TaxID=316089 RepID=UPI0028E61052|nr:(d)CMP kinase [uncultured Granulicatella sp.]